MFVFNQIYVKFVVLFLFYVTEEPKDWSDHALWWPAKNTWLSRTRSTLDQVGVHADAILHFTPMHKALRVQVNYLAIISPTDNFTNNFFVSFIVVARFALS